MNLCQIPIRRYGLGGVSAGTRVGGRVKRCRNSVGRAPLAVHVRKLATATTSSMSAATIAVTPIEQLVLNSIKATGPLSVSSYIQLCLSHPQHGYYMTGDPLGVSGDFITSPEISQVFGELIAIWFLSTFQSNDADATTKRGKTKIRLVELGPGRGTLMNDVLRVMTGPLARSVGLGPSPISSVHLIETSPFLRTKQAEALSAYSDSQGRHPGTSQIPITWHDQIDELHQLEEKNEEDIHTFVIANEFFDALPIHIFEKAVDGWHEVLVDAAPPDLITSPLSPPLSTTLTSPVSTTLSTSSNDKHRLRFVLSATPLPVPFLTSNPRFSSLPIGSRVEYSKGSMDIMRKIGRLIGFNPLNVSNALNASNASNAPNDAKAALDDGDGRETTRTEVKTRASQDHEGKGRVWKGSALLVDYGADHFFSNSLRGVRNHRIVDPFDGPGNSDLTSNVDFATLKDALAGIPNVYAHGPISQHDFLLRMGLEARLSRLLGQNTGEDRRKRIKDAALRLIDAGPQGMGTKFQFMAVTNATVAPYPFPSP